MEVRYVDSDGELDVAQRISEVAVYIKAKCAELGIAVPKILMEPGRSIVADAGMTSILPVRLAAYPATRITFPWTAA